MQRSRDLNKRKKLPQSRGCKVLCCSCRLSVSSSEEGESSTTSGRIQTISSGESSTTSGRIQTISSIAHAMVQERLDQMIRERAEARNAARRSRVQTRHDGTRFVVMVAMEKSSFDPRQDFRESIEQMIVANKIHEAKDLRRLLNYYLTMNSDNFRGVILEVFHDVCTDLFLNCKPH